MEPSSEPLKESWYRTWFDSPYYHRLYSNHDDREAHRFINALLGYFRPDEKARILDLACGKGRFSRFLAQKGYFVTGLDLSENSIREARSFEQPNLSFFQHDMRLPFRINYFDYIFNFFTSFGYFEKESQDLKVLKNVQSGLRRKGVFVLDFFNPDYVIARGVGREVKQLGGIEFHLHKYVDGDFIFKDIRFEADGREWQFRERVRLYQQPDFERMFSQAQLKIRSVFGDYNLNPYHPTESPRLILQAEKRL